MTVMPLKATRRRCVGDRGRRATLKAALAGRPPYKPPRWPFLQEGHFKIHTEPKTIGKLNHSGALVSVARSHFKTRSAASATLTELLSFLRLTSLTTINKQRKKSPFLDIYRLFSLQDESDGRLIVTVQTLLHLPLSRIDYLDWEHLNPISERVSSRAELMMMMKVSDDIPPISILLFIRKNLYQFSSD